MVIINADDWGRDPLTTNRILDCARNGTVSSSSAMVFMEDSERAAGLARDHNLDTGLHLNFTTPFSGSGCSVALVEHQQRLARFLLLHNHARILFRPDLAGSFDYVVRAQLDEYERIYGVPVHHVDGHHHMHLAANVLRQGLIPCEVIVRRNYTFPAGEKQYFNRLYRRLQDERLKKRYRITDYFYDILPLEEAHLQHIFQLGVSSNIEIETHPGLDEEYGFHMSGELQRSLNGVAVARDYVLRAFGGDSAVCASDGGAASGESIAKAVQVPMPGKALPHICVCVCTYKRPQPLKRLLLEVSRQRTDGLFTYSAVVVDNDAARSSEAAVEEVVAATGLKVKYYIEPQRGISRARNMTFAHAEGDYLALIDDDEFPARDWLLKMFVACREYGVDGVLGAVLRHFEQRPPAWLEKSHLLARPVYPTGQKVKWENSRTSNALLKRSIAAGESAPFRVDLRAGEDQEFFYRKIGEGYSFVWTGEAIAFEVISQARCKRWYSVRRALLQGAGDLDMPGFSRETVARSIAAVVAYLLALPFSLLFGGHRFMTVAEKLSFHLGRLLMAAGIDPIPEEYVSDEPQRRQRGDGRRAEIP
jgi:predicted glycoside hydrolase/deacetylase ChbG (UPF0249 family)